MDVNEAATVLMDLSSSQQNDINDEKSMAESDQETLIEVEVPPPSNHAEEIRSAIKKAIVPFKPMIDDIHNLQLRNRSRPAVMKEVATLASPRILLAQRGGSVISGLDTLSIILPSKQKIFLEEIKQHWCQLISNCEEYVRVFAGRIKIKMLHGDEQSRKEHLALISVCESANEAAKLVCKQNEIPSIRTLLHDHATRQITTSTSKISIDHKYAVNTNWSNPDEPAAKSNKSL